MVTIFLTTLLSSYTLIQSSNNQAFATIVNNDNQIADSIKKACPNYVDNGNIKDIVSNILKACLHKGDTSQPQPEPNPETTTPFDENIMNLEMPGVEGIKIIISDSSSQRLNSYLMGDFDETKQFVIPIGDHYVVNVDPDFANRDLQFQFGGNGCSQLNETACSGTMGNSVVNTLITSIESEPPEP